MLGVIAQYNDVPQFQPPPHQNRYSITINQNYIAGRMVFPVQCTGDATNTSTKRDIVYGISSSENYFTMNSTSGVVSMNISARDLPGDGPFTAIIHCGYADVTDVNIAEISVRYQIENQYVPHFMHGGQILDLWVREDHLMRNGSVVTKLNVTDEDLDPCNIVTFEILSGNADGTFTIGSENGVLQLNRELDYDTNPKHNLTIQATNTQCGDRRYSVRTSVCIYVEDIDDEHPTFRQHLYNFSFTEGISPPPINFVQLQCSDADTPNAQIVYRKHFTQDGYPFDIDLRTGNVSATQVLDYEEQAFYNLPFQCYNVQNINVRDTAVVMVNILPVNEHLPELYLSPTFYFLNYTSPVGTLLASATNNSHAPINITATDQDTGLDHSSVQFSLQESNYDSYFHIDRLSGDLTLIHSLDFDVCGSNSVSIITLFIVACNRQQDINRCPSQVLSLFIVHSAETCELRFEENNYVVNVSESRKNGSELLQVHCEVPGKRSSSQQNVIEIVPPTSQFSQTLIIKGNSVFLQQPLDYEEIQYFVVFLHCQSIDRQESNATLTVNILPENDNAPYFEKSLYVFKTSLNDFSVFPKTVGYISAIDKDQGTVNNLMFSLTHNQDFDSTNDVSQYFTLSGTENGTVSVVIVSTPLEDTVVFDISVGDGVFSATSIVLVNVNKTTSQSCLIRSEQCGTICVVLLIILVSFILSTTVIITVVCVRFYYVSKRKLQDRPSTMANMMELHDKSDMGYITIQGNTYRQTNGEFSQM